VVDRWEILLEQRTERRMQMFTRILIAVETAAQIPRVRAVAKLLAKPSTLPTPLHVTLMHATTHALGSAKVKISSDDLEHLTERLRGDGVEARYLLEFEQPERGIVDAASQACADLIVLMPHGRQGLDALSHPSVTAKVLSSATTPLLIWPEHVAVTEAEDFLNLPGAAVILPLDGGELAERALPYAMDLANTFGRSLLLVRVTPDVTPPMTIIAEQGLVTPEIPRAEQEEACSYLAKIRERYTKDAALPIQSMALTGGPGLRLLDLAEAHPGSVIVLRTHGRGPLSSAVLGSVTTELIREGATPVVVIPPHAAAPLARTAPLKRQTAVVG
jgi:nucleotide-binding universal stress UspA family protein